MVQTTPARSLVIGSGEVGQSLYNVLAKTYKEDIYIRDIEEPTDLPSDFDYLHVCFPYMKGFERVVKEYVAKYSPKTVVVHSTVPIGTTRKLHEDPEIECSFMHSPIRGRHPHLEEGIEVFVKFLSGFETNTIEFMRKYLADAGLRVIVLSRSEATEAGKIISTTLYGHQIKCCKQVKELCNKYELNFKEVYTMFNETYNDGYAKLGEGQFRKPILEAMDGPIGGHCIMPNCELLHDPLTAELKEYNSTL